MAQLVSDVSSVLDYQKSKKSAQSERQKILEQMAADETTRSNLVKKVLSQQRAKYGATGNGGKGLSENAVLKRLRGETSEAYDEKRKNNLEKLNQIKTKRPNIIKNWLASLDKIAG